MTELDSQVTNRLWSSDSLLVPKWEILRCLTLGEGVADAQRPNIMSRHTGNGPRTRHMTVVSPMGYPMRRRDRLMLLVVIRGK